MLSEPVKTSVMPIWHNGQTKMVSIEESKSINKLPVILDKKKTFHAKTSSLSIDEEYKSCKVPHETTDPCEEVMSQRKCNISADNWRTVCNTKACFTSTFLLSKSSKRLTLWMLGNFSKNRLYCRLLVITFKFCLLFMGNDGLNSKQVVSQASRRVTRRLAWIKPVCISINAVPALKGLRKIYKTCCAK